MTDVTIMKPRIGNSLYVIGTIALKDIADAIKNHALLGLILALILMLGFPRVINLILEQPAPPLLWYDAGSEALPSSLEGAADVDLRLVDSMEEFEQILSSSGYNVGVELGVVPPDDLEQRLASGEQITFDGYVSWINRDKAERLAAESAASLSEALNQNVRIETQGNYLIPDANSGLLSGMNSLTAITITLMTGLTVLPTLIFEEKQSRTMSVLLVSPASIKEIVTAKAIAGGFYIVVISAVVFGLNLKGIVHWQAALIYTAGCAILSVAIALVLGSFFERQQEIMGWVGVVMALTLAPMFVDLVGISVPTPLNNIIPWMPSVALSDILGSAFSADFSWAAAAADTAAVTAVSLLLYGLVIWRMRQQDR